jgi:hypothetical protein
MNFYLVPSLLIDHGNESLFRGMLLIYYRVTLNRAYFVEYWVANNLVIVSNNRGYRISITCLFYFIRLEVLSPRVERKILIHIVELTQRTRPVASCSGFRVS